tara:strand:- start:8033 stop:8329 length:297 start_codon:yes stop_codon:yes gene_type:complete
MMGFTHVSLVNSMPADGAELDIAPKMVMLTLSEPAKITGFELVKDNGETITVGNLPKEMMAMAHISLPALTSGKYIITWHAAAKDMHAMSGSISFTLK